MYNNVPKSIKRIINLHSKGEIRRQSKGGLPFIGLDKFIKNSIKEVSDSAKIYEKYSFSGNLQIEGLNKPKHKKIRLGGGSPGSFPPYKNMIKNMHSLLDNFDFSYYPLAAGREEDRLKVIEYLSTLGIKNDKPYKDSKIIDNGLSINNVIFTSSSTQAFTFILESIIDFNDVILITAPNYGLFLFNPERLGARIELIDLTCEDNWILDPVLFEKKIIQINNNLLQDYKENPNKYLLRKSRRPPKVIAFLNMNPHNPTGRVYGKSRMDILLDISSICLKNGIFIIDDLIYRELSFNRDEKAIPISSINNMFSNVITLFGISKAFSLSGFRAGMVIADEIIISLIRDKIFQSTDSISVLQSCAVSSVFNKKVNDIEKYTRKVSTEYFFRYLLVKTLVEGIDSINSQYRNNIYNFFLKYKNKSYHDLLYGIDNVSIVKDMEPESGFFVILDFTKLLYKSYSGFKIKDDESFLKFLYTFGNIKLLTGKAFCWPNERELVGRVTYALDPKDIIESFKELKSCISLLQ